MDWLLPSARRPSFHRHNNDNAYGGGGLEMMRCRELDRVAGSRSPSKGHMSRDFVSALLPLSLHIYKGYRNPAFIPPRLGIVVCPTLPMRGVPLHRPTGLPLYLQQAELSSFVLSTSV